MKRCCVSVSFEDMPHGTGWYGLEKRDMRHRCCLLKGIPGVNMNFMRRNMGKLSALCTICHLGHQGCRSPVCPICLQLSRVRSLTKKTPIFQLQFVYFPPYRRSNFLYSSSGTCLLPPCSIRGEGYTELEGCSNTSGQNKSFLQRHRVIHLSVNDTSSSYSSLNDLVCVALLVARETAGGSLEMSLVIVWRCGQGEIERERKGAVVSSSTCCSHSRRHCGTLHLISQILIRPDLGSQRYNTALNFFFFFLLRNQKTKQ